MLATLSNGRVAHPSAFCAKEWDGKGPNLQGRIKQGAISSRYPPLQRTHGWGTLFGGDLNQKAEEGPPPWRRLARTLLQRESRLERRPSCSAGLLRCDPELLVARKCGAAGSGYLDLSGGSTCRYGSRYF